MENLVYVLGLRSINGIGNKIAERLLNQFKSPKEIFSLSEQDLLQIEGIRKDIARSIRNFSDWESIEKNINKAKSYGFKIYTILDESYPKNLLKIYEKPTFIYVLGEIKKEDENAIAMVGARYCNNYGKSIAKSLSSELVENGLTIVSGMARGIDSISHQAAIDAGGRTIAVMGCGLDRIYPPENSRLYKLISENGAVISEFPIGSAPEAQNFPQRNRLISGLSKGIIIVQASIKSGSLITANFALEQNREVFAVPGNLGDKLSGGTNFLIKKGAMLIENANDAIDELNLEGNFESRKKKEEKVALNLDIDQKTVLNAIGVNQLNIDEIFDKTEIEYTKLFSILLDLELEGILEQLPGKIYQMKY